jgi:8-oxo-dGTP pyrophosphatase MutT (NUDIX family)
MTYNPYGSVVTNEEERHVDPEVRAAGAVVWRRTRGKELEILVIHRPKYDDWSIPKGKADPGETDFDCACREVAEETGVVGLSGPWLAEARYVDRQGRSKAVQYYAFEANGTEPTGAQDPEEVDIAEFVPIAEAMERLTYRRDQEIAALFARSQ